MEPPSIQQANLLINNFLVKKALKFTVYKMHSKTSLFFSLFENGFGRLVAVSLLVGHLKNKLYMNPPCLSKVEPITQPVSKTMVIQIAKKTCPNQTTQEITINASSLGYQTTKENKKINERIVKHFLDLIILSQTKKGSITGYDIMTYINENFDVMISPGTVYSTIYSLERQNYLMGNTVGEKRCYSLTETGKQKIEMFISLKNEIIDIIKNIVQ